ncbi:class I SAM-dependent methyltransferase [Aquimarina sp. AD10]|nr:class I SAM-dependent methyltransferase [Aquimarina sp. AD10]RKN00548.1 methyltransferase domain-containing protein [Aquimarina sp. AD10]
MQCTLCGSETILFSKLRKRIFLRCQTCRAIVLHKDHYLTPEQEKERYELHHNDINDLGYKKFVSPIIQAVENDYNPNHFGLDFGSGSGPIVTSLLSKKGYQITMYDPFFTPNTNALSAKYDYIICCEVMEHFYDPAKEFKLLYSLLNQNGSLYCKTNLFKSSIDFTSWWYKNDSTHVFFYTSETLNWIQKTYGFISVTISDKIIVFQK